MVRKQLLALGQSLALSIIASAAGTYLLRRAMSVAGGPPGPEGDAGRGGDNVAVVVVVPVFAGNTMIAGRRGPPPLIKRMLKRGKRRMRS
ncbi:MAG: hypothetical protein JOZ41_07570 [Chloroflexi bacterium]|nr:hypothetical protein [Chloroflexota bacterium]